MGALGDPSFSSPTVHILSKVGGPAIPTLIEALSSPHKEVRRGACWALGEIGSEAQTAVDPLLETVGDEYKWVRMFALRALAKIGTADPAHSSERLIGALRVEEDPGVRADIFDALSALGVPALNAVPMIEQALEDDDPYVRHSALAALAKIRR